MHGRLNELLHRYGGAFPAERELAARFSAFVRDHADCLLRTCAPGHITASTWILSPDDAQCLLTHHRKLGKWLQLGGHVDGEERIELAALREAQEESGMQHFDLLQPPGGLVPLDLDVHPIPARAGEPAHDHWDVRFLLRARPGQAIARSAESNDLRWVPVRELEQWTREESVVRLQRKAAVWLGSGGFLRPPGRPGPIIAS
jgi:8-oxo-dGTP pyrophosphatase MutT (NUDIX family)